MNVVEPQSGFLDRLEEQGTRTVRDPEGRGRVSPQDQFITLALGYAVHRICNTSQEGVCTAWDDVKLRSYNGQLGGPRIEAWPGDTLNITLVNQLPPNPESDKDLPENGPHGFNTTNLHFHGMHVSPVGNADNVMLELEPGHHFHYEVKIPLNHPAGTYWYHAHKHGAGAMQLGSGMAGALIIRGDIDRVPAIRAARERVILFQQIPYDKVDDPTVPGQQINGVEGFSQFGPGKWGSLGRRFTLNGEVEPTFELRPGEVERWRFIHGGVREGLQLRLVERRGTQETPLVQYQIAHDGITTGRLDAVTLTEMYPGYRTDVLVRAARPDGSPLPPGTYFLVNGPGLPDVPNDPDVPGDPNVPAHTLARIVVRGYPRRMALPKPLELGPLAPFATITDADVEGQGVQKAIFSIDLSTRPPRFLINNEPFSHERVRQLPLGAVQEWTVGAVNINHPFHIHVNPFQLILEDGRILWKDTLLLRQGQTYTLRTRYDRYIGMFMLHCHIADHADQGMAEMVEVVMEGGEHAHSTVH